ncbi:MAG: response regulator transcription factor [Thermoanaerobaculia bacterium]
MTTEPNSLSILIVENDEPTQNLLRTVLLRCGYASDIASNGREAIDRLGEKSYAAVVLDIMMPGVGGHEVVAFLRTSGNRVPVIICSAAGTAALTGFDETVVKAIVRKPFDIDELAAAVTSVVGGGAE